MHSLGVCFHRFSYALFRLSYGFGFFSFSHVFFWFSLECPMLSLGSPMLSLGFPMVPSGFHFSYALCRSSVVFLCFPWFSEVCLGFLWVFFCFLEVTSCFLIGFLGVS